jgi:hypothetical protein
VVEHIRAPLRFARLSDPLPFHDVHREQGVGTRDAPNTGLRVPPRVALSGACNPRRGCWSLRARRDARVTGGPATRRVEGFNAMAKTHTLFDPHHVHA